jgi:hypothetical protein
MMLIFWLKNLFQQRWGHGEGAVAANDDLSPAELVSTYKNWVSNDTKN